MSQERQKRYEYTGKASVHLLSLKLAAALRQTFKAGGQAHVQSLEVFENEALRGEIFQTWMALTTGSKKKRGRVHSWSDSERTLVSGELDETSIIAANSDFIGLMDFEQAIGDLHRTYAVFFAAADSPDSTRAPSTHTS